MRTMFVSRENNTKKKFQKPNILRRKPKTTTRPNKTVAYESPNVKSLVTVSYQQEPTTHVLQSDHIKGICSKPCQNGPVLRLGSDNNYMTDENAISESYIDDTSSELTATSDGVLINNNEESISQTPLNVESFLNGSALTQNITQFEIDNEIDTFIKHEWCLDLSNNGQEIIIENFRDPELCSAAVEENCSMTTMVPLSAVSSSEQEEINSTDVVSTAIPIQNLSIEYLTCSSTNFKCDVPECNKRFRSEQNLKKHKEMHNEGSTKTLRLVNVECPVKRLQADGTEEPCGRVFLIREELVKHLKEDHSPEEANYICEECGRRFFWASGVRAHARAHCGPPPALACAWPGCGREFRQPCRLREHTRAHTGDKPYPCRYPNCGWSFRTASKLQRHARRHTGERRHACAACGRAFPRREHLRDHAERHHRDKQPCAQAGCHRTFTNVEALFRHMRKVHKEEPTEAACSRVTRAAAPEAAPVETLVETTNMVRLDSPAGLDAVPDTTSADEEVVAEVCAGAEAEWHAARTHCTWPLAPRAEPVYEEAVAGEYILEEDVQVSNVELSEGSESNIYTIRSDLFLNGNVLTNEDSDQLDGSEEAAHGAEAGSLHTLPPAGDAGLGLMDAHPTIDLMQEELMYPDTAVDESSFRVFLLSGEELG